MTAAGGCRGWSCGLQGVGRNRLEIDDDPVGDLGSPQGVDDDELDVRLALVDAAPAAWALAAAPVREALAERNRERIHKAVIGDLRSASVSLTSRATDRLHGSGSTARKAYR